MSKKRIHIVNHKGIMFGVFSNRKNMMDIIRSKFDTNKLYISGTRKNLPFNENTISTAIANSNPLVIWNENNEPEFKIAETFMNVTWNGGTYGNNKDKEDFFQ